MKSLSRKWVAAGFAIAGVVFVQVFVVSGFSGSEQLVGAFWTANVDDEQRLFFVTAHSNRSLGGGRSSPSVHEKTVYHLVARATADGAARVAVDLGENQFVEILGITGGWIWLWRTQDRKFGLEARDLETLQVGVSSENIRQANPEYLEVLPNDKEFITIPTGGDVVIVKTLDARRFIVGMDDGILQSYSTSLIEASPELPAETQEQEMKRLRGAIGLPFALAEGGQLAGYLVEHYCVDSLLEADAWYALLTPEKLADLSRSSSDGWTRVPRSGAPDQNESAGFYRMTSEYDSQVDERVIDPSSAEVLRPDRYLMAGFVLWRGVAPDPARVLLLADPPSLIMLSKKTLSEDSTWQLHRLGLDGTVLWQTDTGLIFVHAMITSEQTLVLAGYAEISGRQRASGPFLMQHLDVRTGDLSSRGLESNE